MRGRDHLLSTGPSVEDVVYEPAGVRAALLVEGWLRDAADEPSGPPARCMSKMVGVGTIGTGRGADQ